MRGPPGVARALHGFESQGSHRGGTCRPRRWLGQGGTKQGPPGLSHRSAVLFPLRPARLGPSSLCDLENAGEEGRWLRSPSQAVFNTLGTTFCLLDGSLPSRQTGSDTKVHSHKKCCRALLSHTRHHCKGFWAGSTVSDVQTFPPRSSELRRQEGHPRPIRSPDPQQKQQ